MAQLSTMEVHVNVDLSSVRAKVRRLGSIVKELNIELAQAEERLDALQERHALTIEEHRAQLAELGIRLELEDS